MSIADSTQRVPSKLRSELMRHAPQYRKVLFFSLIANMLALAPILFMLEVYDRVVTSRNETTLLMLLGLVIGAYVVIEALELVRASIMAKVGLNVDGALRGRLFDAAFEINLHRGGGSGSTHVFNDLRTLREFMGSPALVAIMDAPASIVFLLIKFLIHPLLGFLTLVAAGVQVLIAVRTEKRIMPALTEANRSAIEAQGYAASTLRNTQVIEAMGMMGDIQRRWMGVQRKFLQLQADASDHAGTNSAAGRFLQTGLTSLILGVSAWLHLKGGLAGGAGMMIVASILGGRVLVPLVQIVDQWRLVVNARDAYGRLDAIMENLPVPSPAMSLPPPKGLLSVESITVTAPGGATVPILRNVSFALHPGELLVVIGPSACGKTTLARALTGVWPSAAGKVRLDGVDVYGWNKEELGPHVGYLPQGVELFDGSLAENIARFGKVDDDKVRVAARMAGLEALAESLPQTYDTRIGEEGAFLSGGQRQRVGIARAVYGMPRFVVLDEPNSSLDDDGEEALLNTLRRLKAAQCTTVVISHRTSVLPVADKMLVLRGGQVGAFGPPDKVIEAMRSSLAQRGQTPAAAAAGVAPQREGI